MRGTIGVLACLMVARLAVGMKGGRPIRAEEHRYLVGIQQNNVTWCVGVILDPLRVILPDDCLRKSPLIEVTEADVVPLVNGNPPRKYKGRFSLSDSGQIYTELDVVVIHIDHPGMELAESIDQNDFPSSASISKKKPTPTDSIVIGQRRVGVMTILEDSECFQQIGTLYFPMNDRLQSIKLMLGEKLMCAVRTNFTMSIGDIPPGQACPQDLGAPVIQDGTVVGILVKIISWNPTLSLVSLLPQSSSSLMKNDSLSIVKHLQSKKFHKNLKKSYQISLIASETDSLRFGLYEIKYGNTAPQRKMRSIQKTVPNFAKAIQKSLLDIKPKFLEDVGQMATSRILVESEKALNKSDQETVGYSEERKTDVGLGDIPMAIEDNSSTTDNSTTISGDYGNITGDFQNQTADFKSQFEAAGNQTEYYKNRTEDFRNHTEVRNARLSNPNFSDVGTFSVEPLDLIPIVVNVSVVVQDMTNVENQNVMGKIVAKGGAHATQLIENSSSLSVMTDNSSKEQNQVSSAAAKIRKKDANKTEAVLSPNATREPIMVINLEPAIPPEKTKNSSRLTSEETMQKHIHLERTEQTFDVMTGAEVVITFAPDTTKKVAAARKVSSSSARMFLIDMKTFLVLFFVYSKLMSFRLN